MATFSGSMKRVAFFAVLLGLVFGLVLLSQYIGKLEPSVKAVRVGEAVGQSICGINAFESKTDSCANGTANFVQTGVKMVSSTPVQHNAEAKEKLKVLLVVEVPKGKGCVETTAKTPYPMSAAVCKDFLAKHGMKPWVDHRNPMMQIEREAIIPLGTRFVFFRIGKDTGWTVADTD